MRSRPNLRRNDLPRGGMPSLYKRWFAFVTILTVIVWSTIGYLVFTVATDPASIGRFLGSVAQGYQERRP